MPAPIVPPHPGQVYTFSADAAPDGCTIHVPERFCSVRFIPAVMRARSSGSGSFEIPRRRRDRLLRGTAVA